MAAIPDQYVDRIKDFEGSKDSGWDHKQFSGPYGVRRGPNEHLTLDQADQRMQGELGNANAVVKSLGVPLPLGIEAALTSLTYNAGSKWLHSGLGQALRDGDFNRARQLFLQYNKAGGATEPGLVRRRQQELAWWDEGGAPDARVASAAPMPSGAVDSAIELPTAEVAQETPAGVSDAVLDSLLKKPDSTPTSAPQAKLEEKESAPAPASPVSASSQQSFTGNPNASLRAMQALDMARAATPYIGKIDAGIVPKLHTEKMLQTASLDPSLDNGDDEMRGLGEPFRRAFADGGAPDDNPWLGTRQSSNVEDRTGNWGDTLGAIYDQAAAVPGQFGRFLGSLAPNINRMMGRLPSGDDYQQLGSMMPKTEPHPYTGAPYRTPNVNPDGDGFNPDTALAAMSGAALSHVNLAPKPLMPMPTNAEEVKGPENYADGGATPAWYAKQEARGMTHSGPLMSAVPGRTDQLPISVKSGSYVVPADVVSALGEGNTAAGNNILKSMFTGPFGMPTLHSRGLSGTRSSKRSSGFGAPKATPLPKIKPTKYAAGGVVPIIAAGGEYVIDPDQVAQVGNGDMEQGHAILDAFVNNVRAQHIKTLQSLPGPNK